MEQLFKLFYQTTGVCTDTRKIEKDSLFICLKGDNFNGNEFANEALQKGAKYVICDEKEYANNETIFLVNNCLLFLQNLANHHRLQFNIPVIGITGSNGKTSSKELINATLSKKFKVLATIGNLNNHIGVPLTLLRLTDEHEIAIIEMGANKFKDIEELCNIAEPNYGIITNIGKAHLEGMKSFEGILKTKSELYVSILENEGKLIVNGDDDVLMNAAPKGVPRRTYGQKTTNDISGELIALTPLIEMRWSMEGYTSPAIKTSMIGKYNFYNFLAAIAFGIEFGVTPEEINEAISSYEPTNNRSQVSKTAKNTLILDCYNANPTSMRSAIESFAMIDNDRKIFILGDMLELGEESKKEHEGVIGLLKETKLNGILVGPIFNSLKNKGGFTSFETLSEAENHLKELNPNDRLILLKGSRGIGLEKLQAIL